MSLPMDVTRRRFVASQAFAAAAYALMAVDTALVLLSLACKLVAHQPWVTVVYLSVFRLPGAGLPAALLTPQALFAPLTTLAVMSLWPLAMQVWCLWLMIPVMQGWKWQSRLVYTVIAFVPIFGPAGAHTLMKTQENLLLDD